MDLEMIRLTPVGLRPMKSVACVKATLPFCNGRA